jgi:hypothetical protein
VSYSPFVVFQIPFLERVRNPVVFHNSDHVYGCLDIYVSQTPPDLARHSAFPSEMTTAPPANGDPPASYVDFDTLLSSTFSPHAYANTLITSTNNPTDTQLDLSTPLSRVLFDVQEVDTRIHNLTTQSALPIIEYTQSQNAAAQRVLKVVEDEVERANGSYARLEREVLVRYREAEAARRGAQRTWEVLKLGRAVNRIVGLARQVEGLMSDSGLGQVGRQGKEDHKAVLRAVYPILTAREIVSGEEGKDLSRVNVVRSMRNEVLIPEEEKIKSRAQQIVREFSMSSLSGATTFSQTEDAKARTTSAVTMLYLLSPIPTPAPTVADFQPDLLIRALQHYLQNAVTSSAASIGRALTTLPTLERTLVEVSARCQNIVALETLLAGISTPEHPLLGLGPADPLIEDANLLQPLLHCLDTSSLASYFWRSLASSLSARVQDIVGRGGVSARTLKTNRDRVRDEIRQCVLQGSQLPSGAVGRGAPAAVPGNWEREAAVMVGSVVGALGR